MHPAPHSDESTFGNCVFLDCNYLLMPKFTAFVFAHEDDTVHLDRALESLKVANDVLLINADRSPEIKRIGRKHHAREKNGIPGVTPGAYAMDAFHQWVLVLRPFEALSNELIRSLQEWRKRKKDESQGYCFGVLEQEGHKWRNRVPEFRLANRKYVNWIGELPENGNAPVLPGPLLRYETGEQQQRLAS
jgi:hypothetical protein